jgi:putative copper export protein/peroxiredoxin
MTALLLAAVWVHLAACVLLAGATFMLLLAGPPTVLVISQWERRVLSGARWLSAVALASGLAWLTVRTALFEGRPYAALEARAIWRSMLDTWPGQVWMVRHGLLIVLTAFLLAKGDVSDRRNWLAARLEAFALAALALILLGGSSHAAASSESPWPLAIDMVHLLGAGIWVGGLPPLALLLYVASRDAAMPDPCAVRAVQRFSRMALVTVLVLFGSGMSTALLLVQDIAGLVGTTHGQLLLAKLAVLLLALLLAAASRMLLPALSAPIEAKPSATARRMALFVALEAGLVLVLLGLAAAMTVSTPARHGNPVWPWSVRLSLDPLLDSPILQTLIPLWSGTWLVALAVLFLLALLFALRRPVLLIATVSFLFLAGAGIGLAPLMVEAYPTSYVRPPITYHAGSIAEGITVYQAHCASCHGMSAAARETSKPSSVNLRSPATARRTAGELYWLITHGRSERGMPEFGTQLSETQRWHVINFLRAAGSGGDPRRIGPEVELDRAWLAAPDFTITVGPLSPRQLRDYRGRQIVLLVLYDLPLSRERMTELARRYGALSVLGVEVIAVPQRASPHAIAALGASPPVLFPVVTDGNEAIVATYRLFASSATHAELLIDRQGYIRAIWRSDETGMPDAAAVQAQVEKLNEEKAPPPLPSDHVH